MLAIFSSYILPCIFHLSIFFIILFFFFLYDFRAQFFFYSYAHITLKRTYFWRKNSYSSYYSYYYYFFFLIYSRSENNRVYGYRKKTKISLRYTYIQHFCAQHNILSALINFLLLLFWKFFWQKVFCFSFTLQLTLSGIGHGFYAIIEEWKFEIDVHIIKMYIIH